MKPQHLAVSLINFSSHVLRKSHQVELNLVSPTIGDVDINCVLLDFSTIKYLLLLLLLSLFKSYE